MKNILKKWWFYVIIIIIIILLSIKGCESIKVLSLKNNAGDAIEASLKYNRGGTSPSISEDTFIRYLTMELEPLTFPCVMGEGDCMMTCLDGLFVCGDEEADECFDTCDTTYPLPDDYDECSDTCDTVEEVCYDECAAEYELSGNYNFYNAFEIIPAAYAIADDFDIEYEEYLEDCENECYREWDECNYLCDEEYNDCCGVCVDTYISPCFGETVDCIYTCLEDCVIGDEIVVWDGSEVTDISNFYTTNFPQFTEQFAGICEWLIFGDFASTPNKFGCVDYAFFGDWFASHLDSINSMEEVCITIGGEFIIGDGEISCNI